MDRIPEDESAHGGRDGLLSIGAFSRATHLSQKALRLYDRHGLLRPAHTDPESGYRYYRTEQVRVAKLILLMRRLNMPLAKIQILTNATPQEATDMVEAYWRAAEAEAVRAGRVTRELVSRLLSMTQWEGPDMTTTPTTDRLTVTSIEAGPQVVLGITKRVKIDGLEEHLTGSLRRLRQFVAEQPGVEAAGDAFGIYHGPVNRDDDGPMEVCLPVRGAVTPVGDIVAREIPAMRRAVATGGEAEGWTEFPKVLRIYDQVYEWIEANGFQPEGAPWEFSPALGLSESAIRVEWPYKAK